MGSVLPSSITECTKSTMHPVRKFNPLSDIILLYWLGDPRTISSAKLCLGVDSINKYHIYYGFYYINSLLVNHKECLLFNQENLEDLAKKIFDRNN